MNKDLADKDKLYAITMACAKYNAQGCNCECGVCQFNVFNYVDDVREAGILKATAYADFTSAQEANKLVAQQDKAHTAANLTMAAIIIGVIIFAVSSIATCFIGCKPNDPIPFKDFTPTAADNKKAADIIYDTNNLSNIPKIIALLEKYGPNDWNNDGYVTCIDYAIQFRMFYGIYARLVQNYNPAIGMNHMFVQVYVSYNNYIDVEPQGTALKYKMPLIWGDKYDPKFNIDVTDWYAPQLTWYEELYGR